jgi:hypothetical protein
VGIENVSKPAGSPEASSLQQASPADLVSGLPSAALYAAEFQPLLRSLDPAQEYEFSPRPLPYAVSEAHSEFLANPELFIKTLQSASKGLEAAQEQHESLVGMAGIIGRQLQTINPSKLS